MPAQPLTNCPKVQVSSFNVGAYSNDEAETFHIAMQVIARCSYLDENCANLFVLIMKSVPEIGFNLYYSLPTDHAKISALKSASKSVLSDENHALVEAVLEGVAAVKQIRNKFAHNIWGTAVDLPECLILADPRVLTVMQADGLRGDPPLEYDRSKMFLWRRSDLMDALTDANAAIVCLRNLSESLFATNPLLYRSRVEMLSRWPRFVSAFAKRGAKPT